MDQASDPTDPSTSVPSGITQIHFVQRGADRLTMRAIETQQHRMERLLDTLIAERQPPPAAPPPPAASVDPADLLESPVVHVPAMTVLAQLYLDRARAAGLPLPPDGKYRIIWHAAPSFRRQDGVTLRQRNGSLETHLNASMPAECFAETVWHEGQHLADLFHFRDGLAVEVMEHRAELFVRRMLTPPEPAPTLPPPLAEPEPVCTANPWGGRRA
jgi:hypothetical protein